jgi:hypothetical protein
MLHSLPRLVGHPGPPFDRRPNSSKVGIQFDRLGDAFSDSKLMRPHPLGRVF